MGASAISGPTGLLLSSFNNPKDLSEVYEQYEEYEKQSGRHFYRDIVSAIKDYLKQAPKVSTVAPDNSAANDVKNSGYPEVVVGLREIFSFDEKHVNLRKADLFSEAVKDGMPRRGRNQGSAIMKNNDELNSNPAYITVQALCLVDPKMAFTELDAEGYTPFEGSSKDGAAGLARIMIAELLNSLEKEYPDKSERKKKVQTDYLSKARGKAAKTAFFLAAENLKQDVLELFLEDFPELADLESIESIIQKTASNQPKSQKAALEAFKLIVNCKGAAGKTAKWSDIWRAAVRASSLTVVHHLLKESERAEEFVTYENAKFVMEQGSIGIWKEFSREQREDLIDMGKKDLLHTAVKHLNADIVEEIVEQFPDQIKVDIGSDREAKYPMQLLAEADQDAKFRPKYDRIRDVLLHAMIRSTSEEMGIRDIRRILRDSKVEANTICLHLSNIDTQEQKFTDYVQWLQDQNRAMGKIFKFERILKYANFPDLHTQTPKNSEDIATSLRIDYNEINVVIDWLQDRGVRQILELSVPDRLFCPHSDDDVRSCMVEMKVRILKWRKLDLYLGNLEEKNDLEELHLYSSGNPSVHEQWYRELPRFSNLSKLYVYVVRDVLSEKRVKEVKNSLQERLDEINRNKLHGRWTKARFDYEKEVVDGRSVRKVPVMVCDWVKNTEQRRYRKLEDITSDVVGPKLATFIEKYKTIASTRPGFTKTKVALIDSGVVVVDGKAKAQTHTQAPPAENKIQDVHSKEPASDDDTKQENRAKLSTNDLAHHIVDGKSFVNTGDDEEHVWWHASEPHGTQMARLICSIDPCCELYVIKVAETRGSGISANVVAEAIRWAIKRGVDVISLSLVAYTDTDQMSQAIRDANKEDIVILSSTADEGVVVKPTAAEKETHRNNKDVFTIAACDKWGNPLDRSQKEGYDYRFIGHDVYVGQVPFLRSSESISGSSVATAIAAGTASLIIACSRIFAKDKEKPGWRCRMVTDIFWDMLEGSEKKYVLLENLYDKGIRRDDFDFQQLVKNRFRWISQNKF